MTAKKARSEVHSLYNLQFALKVCEQLPTVLDNFHKVQVDLDKHIEKCYDYMHYLEVSNSHAFLVSAKNQIDDSISMLKLHLKEQQKIVDNKGKINYASTQEDSTS